MVILTEFWLLLMLFDVVLSFKTGAPTSMCSSMMPHHNGTKAQNTTPPYRIKTASNTTAEDGRISFKIKGNPFLGIILQARKNANQTGAIGSFVTPNSLKTITCDNFTNSAVTHRDSSKKENIELEWQAPPNWEGNIIFVATIVSNYSTFWTGITSQPVRVKKYTKETNETPDNVVKPNLYEGCDTSKDCLGFPDGCLQQRNCQTVVTVISGNELVFEMMSLGSKYVALGISKDREMGGDYVAECVLEGDNVKSYESWNVASRKENIRLPGILRTAT